MMLRTSNNEFIEVEDVEVERQAKLFQNIGDTSGDFSYEFNIDNNSENLAKLNILSPVDGFMKSIYTVSDIALCDDDGGVLYNGYVRITGINDDEIQASFFSGNNNWFAEMSGDLKDIDWTDFEVEISETTIPASWTNTSGVVFPLINTGAMSSRSTQHYKLDDFQPFIHVKDVVKRCFLYSGLKLAGDIVSDWRYGHLITTTNRSSVSSRIAERIVKVSKVINEAIGTSYQVVDFEVENSVGDLGIWDNTNYRYIADIRMQVEVTVTITNSDGGGGGQSINVILAKNGDTANPVGGFSRGSNDTFTKNFPNLQRGIIAPIILEPGDYLDIQAIRFGGVSIDITEGSLTITPVKLLNVFAESLLPESKQLDFVLSVFKLFNTVIEYDSFTKTVTVDFFKNIIRSDEVELSEYIDTETIKIDYQELISDYAKVNNLMYDDTENDLIVRYNSGKIYGYGSGQIDSGNEFTDKTKDVLESIFVPTAEDNNNPFGVTLPKIDFTELETGQEFSATISNSGGALFTVSATFAPAVGDLVEVFTSTDDSYLGQWSISTVPTSSTFRLSSVIYSSSVTVSIRKLQVKSKDNSDQVLLLGDHQTPFSEFCDYDFITIETTAVFDDPFYSWFYKPETGRLVDALDRSLSFGHNNIPLSYQKTMIEDYWADLGPILRDPVKVYVDAYLPKSVFDSITFKQPLRIKCDRFNSRFYPNRITGYKDSSQPCTLELIKLP